MKKIIAYLSVVLSIGYLSSCDKIEGNHFKTTTVNTNTSGNVYRILLEDYTGHTCGNCPAAARDLYNNIKPTYGDKLITIGVHANFFAEPCPPHSRPPGAPAGSYSDDFRTQAGEDWYTFFQFYSNPLGMVNRKDYTSGNEIKTESSWNGEIASIINDTPKVAINISNVYNTSTRQLQTSCQAKFLSQVAGNYKLTVVLTEDSIVTWQLDDAAADPNDSNYVERHVLRGSLNGSFGELIDSASVFNAGSTYTKQYTTTLNSGWNANHVYVIAFLFDTSTYEILNVAEKAIVQ